MVVQHNLTAMNSNRMLGLTNSAQAKSTEKLSSGYKINRAADDAAGLSISEKMRKQIRGLTQASLNAEDGISAVQTAEGALNEVQDMLQRMNELAVKAANGTMSESDRSYIQNEVDQLVTEIDRVSETTKFNETYLLKGDNTVDPKQTYSYKKIQYTAAETGALYDANGNEIEEGAVLDPAAKYYATRTGAVSSKVVVADDAGLLTSTEISLASNVYTKGADGVVSEIAANQAIAVGTTVYETATDAAKGENGVTLEAVADVSDPGEITVGNTADIAITVKTVTSDITLYDADAKEVAAGTSIAIDDIVNYGKAVTYTVSDEIASDDFAKYGNAKQLTDKDGNEVAANGLYSYFDAEGNYKGGLFQLVENETTGENELVEITTKSDVLTFVDDTAKKETGALTLSLHVGADATENNQISVDIDAMSASSLGVEGLKVDGKDDYNALRAIETIKASIQMVSEQRSALGAVQNRLEHTIANLDNVVENTTAAESQIRDTDMATEMVKYSNNNILAQAGQSMLAQANQANQGVLSLLG